MTRTNQQEPSQPQQRRRNFAKKSTGAWQYNPRRHGNPLNVPNSTNSGVAGNNQTERPASPEVVEIPAPVVATNNPGERSTPRRETGATVNPTSASSSQAPTPGTSRSARAPARVQGQQGGRSAGSAPTRRPRRQVNKGGPMGVINKAFTAYGIELFEDINMAAFHGKRVTAKSKDLQLIQTIRGRM